MATDHATRLLVVAVVVAVVVAMVVAVVVAVVVAMVVAVATEALGVGEYARALRVRHGLRARGEGGLGPVGGGRRGEGVMPPVGADTEGGSAPDTARWTRTTGEPEPEVV